MKNFEIKLYSKDWVLKMPITTWTGDIVYSEELNGGQSDLSLQVVGSGLNISCTDIVEIQEVSDTQFVPSPTYSGIIEEIIETEYETTSTLTLRILWVHTAFSDILYRNWTNREFTKTGTAGAIITDIINSFNSQYGTLAETNNLGVNLIWLGNIDMTGTSLSISFANESCLSAIGKVMKDSWFNWFVWADWLFHLFENLPEKTYTLGNEILFINKKVHKKDMINSLYLKSSIMPEQYYNDSTAITTYGLKEKYLNEDGIESLATQNQKWAQRVADYKDPRLEVSIIMKEQDAQSLIPGTMMNIQNSTLLVNSRIEKITKWRNWTVYVWDYSSFWKVFQKSIKQ